MKAEKLIEEILESSSLVRYAAVAPDSGSPVFRQREGVKDGPAADSDLYEEIFVNPVLLELAKRRGTVDCGGMKYLTVRYGHFFQLVIPLPDGHLSVCFEEAADPIAHVETIREIAEKHGIKTATR